MANDDIAAFGQIDVTLYKKKVTIKADLPTPLGGFIDLADDTFYQIQGSFSQGTDKIRFGNKTVFGAEVPGLAFVVSFTGTGSQFIASDVNARMKNITINSGTADFILAENTAGNEGTNSMIVEDFTLLNCDSIGSTDNLLFFVLRRGFVAQTATNGLTVVGSDNKNIILFDNTFASHSGNLFDLGSSVTEIFHIDRCEIHYPGSSTFLSGLAASANIAIGGFGFVTGNNLIDDGGALLNNIAVNDIRWTFASKGIELSSIKGELIINTPASTTVLNGTYVKVAGTTTLKLGNRISTPSDMVMQYNNLEPSDRFAIFVINIQKDSGADRIYDMAMFLGGFIIGDSVKANITITTSPVDIMLLTIIEDFVTGDQVEPRIQGVGTTDAVTVNSVNLIIS